MDRDTNSAAMMKYHELLREAGPEKRLHAAVSLGAAVRALAMAGLKQRHPEADEEELRTRLAVRLYGRALALEVFEHVPDDAV